MLEAALQYAQRGWRCFPVGDVQGHRQPLLKAWQDKATTDPQQLAAWWRRWPEAEVAICTGPGSNLLVIDLDEKKGQHGLTEWQLLVPDGYTFRGPHVRTASGGEHLYYFTDSADYHNSASVLAPGIDVRAWHGFVLAPPAGGRTWLTEPGIVPPLPTWLAALLDGATKKSADNPTGNRSTLSELLENPPEAEGEGRNEWLTRVAGHYAKLYRAQRDTYVWHCHQALELLLDPLPTAEAERTIESVWRMEHAKVDTEPLTDTGNSRRLVAKHGDGIRYVPGSKSWYVWDGTRWCPDSRLHIQELAMDTARAISAEAINAEDSDDRKRVLKWALTSQSAQRIESMIKLARSAPGMPVEQSAWDADPLELNTLTGVLHLGTGHLSEHTRLRLISKLSPVKYDPQAESPLWHQFLTEIFQGEKELIAFIRRAAGYSLTGSINERAIFFLHGGGRNGKSTFLNVLRHVFGDYGTKTQADTLVQKRNGGSGVNNNVAALRGARLVTASESEEGDRLATAVVKDLTGGESLVARFLYGEFFEFVPQFKLWLATNHKPNADSTDQAIWDRILLVPFHRRFEDHEVDRELAAKLIGEAPGILNWLLQGALEWQERGLRPPEVVRLATEEYREEGDTLGDFLSERCAVVAPDAPASRYGLVSEIYMAYRQWCESAGIRPLGRGRLVAQLGARGYEKVRSNGARLRSLSLSQNVQETSNPDPRNVQSSTVGSQSPLAGEVF